MDEKTLRQVEDLIGYQFSNKSILKEALLHASQAEDRLESNERLEFFGDSILDMVICESLFEKYPAYFEGQLTKIKSLLVSRKTCACIGNKLGLTDFLRVGKGMFGSRSLDGSIAAGTVEAVIAAIYLDGGYEKAREFILSQFGDLMEQAGVSEHHENFKSLLQQHAQQYLNCVPIYELLDEKGPDHYKCFETAVIINGKRFKSAWGNNKKESEQKAAYNALIKLGVVCEDSDQEF